MMGRKITLPKQLELANYLGVSIQCVRQYPKKKRYLMWKRAKGGERSRRKQHGSTLNIRFAKKDNSGKQCRSNYSAFRSMVMTTQRMN